MNLLQLKKKFFQPEVLLPKPKRLEPLRAKKKQPIPPIPIIMPWKLNILAMEGESGMAGLRSCCMILYAFVCFSCGPW